MFLLEASVTFKILNKHLIETFLVVLGWKGGGWDQGLACCLLFLIPSPTVSLNNYKRTNN